MIAQYLIFQLYFMLHFFNYFQFNPLEPILERENPYNIYSRILRSPISDKFDDAHMVYAGSTKPKIVRLADQTHIPQWQLGIVDALTLYTLRFMICGLFLTLQPLYQNQKKTPPDWSITFILLKILKYFLWLLMMLYFLFRNIIAGLLTFMSTPIILIIGIAAMLLKAYFHYEMLQFISDINHTTDRVQYKALLRALNTLDTSLEITIATHTGNQTQEICLEINGQSTYFPIDAEKNLFFRRASSINMHEFGTKLGQLNLNTTNIKAARSSSWDIVIVM